ncbi:MAG: hypothetical protein RL148_2250 [Planctomycetota bacterium]
MVQVYGVLNLTRDSFSDGGLYLETDKAVEHGLQLLADGADVIDVGAQSSHPDAHDVPADEEIQRLVPVVDLLLTSGARVSIDTTKPLVMLAMQQFGVHVINDVNGMRDPQAVAAVAAGRCEVVVMFSRSPDARAHRVHGATEGLLDTMCAFFADRVQVLEAAGVKRERIVLDPGMGFFLGDTPEPSLHVLRHLRELRERTGMRVMAAPSRKSFLGAVTGRGVHERGAATLAAELWAVDQGVDAIRTHDVRALKDALAVRKAVAEAP